LRLRGVYFAIALRLLCDRSVVALRSLATRFAIALRSLRGRFAIALRLLCDCSAIALQLLCDCAAIALRLLCDRFAIALRSLCDRSVFALRLLCARFALAKLLSYNPRTFLSSSPSLCLSYFFLFSIFSSLHFISPSLPSSSPLFLTQSPHHHHHHHHHHCSSPSPSPSPLHLRHLDALAGALAAFDGGLLLVSHDSDFAAQVGCDRILDLAFETGQQKQSTSSPKKTLKKKVS
jgi:hypothetical protein